LKWNGKDEMKKKCDELLNSENDIKWFKFNIEGKDWTDIKYVCDGTDSTITKEWKESNLDPNLVSYIIMSTSTSEGGYGVVRKFIFLIWVGGKIKPLSRVKCQITKPAVFKFTDDILHFAAEFQATSSELFTHEIVYEKLTGSKVRGKEMEVKQKQEKFKDLGKQKTELSYTNPDKIYEMLEKLVNEDEKLNWFSVTYEKNTIDKIEHHSNGEGGLEEFKNILKDDDMIFIVFSLKWSRNYVKDLEGLAKTFYGMVQWNGKNISVLEKALNSHHFNDFSYFIKKKMDQNNYNISGGHLHTDDINEINYEKLIKVMNLFD
jgi:hypothetical protein